MKVTFGSMAYRRRTLLLGTVATFAVGACSFTNLDKFSSGPLPAPDGGQSDASAEASASSSSGETSSEGGDVTSEDPYGDAVRADMPSAWWRFEDADGATTLHDEMGQHDAKVYPMKEVVSIEWGAPGAVGKAAHIGNEAGYFDVGDVFDFQGQAEFALEAWVKNEAPTTEYEGIFTKRLEIDGAPDTGWLVFFHKPESSLGFEFWRKKDMPVNVEVSPLPPGFHHLVTTATQKGDGVEYTMYLDGEARNTTAKITASELDTKSPLLIGPAWSGSLDEIAIYEHSLSPERVRAHHLAARP